jgi:hypothetical protein
VAREWYEVAEPQDDTALRDIDTTVAHPARVYDYWLGGKDNFAVDREAAEEVLRARPAILLNVRSNRAFLARSVRYLAGQAGMRQFLDIGTGIPSANNTHEVAQSVAPEARIVYVDNDPIVLAHARALLTSTSGLTAYIDADLHDTGTILAEAARTLDFTQPVAVMLIAVLHLIPDEDDPWGIVSALMRAVPSGSYLVITHPASDIEARSAARAAQRYNERVGSPMRRPGRGRAGPCPAASVAARGRRPGCAVVRLRRRGPQAVDAGQTSLVMLVRDHPWSRDHPGTRRDQGAGMAGKFVLQSALHGIESVKENAPGAEVDDQAGE